VNIYEIHLHVWVGIISKNYEQAGISYSAGPRN